MEITTLQKELISLYKATMDYDFRKATYDGHMDSLQGKYNRLLAETARVWDGAESEKECERLVLCVPEYVAGKLASEPSKRKREMQSLDHKMNMVSYFVPLMGQIPTENAQKFAGKIVEAWNRLMPENKIGLSTYESIKGGFKKGIFCYITTAVCRSLEKPDDCYELTALRHYRDEYLLSTAGGRSLVDEYYNIAPTIVKRIDRQADADAIYRGIWEQYLSPCVRLLEEDKKEECRKVYCQMVRNLETQYMYRKDCREENDR